MKVILNTDIANLGEEGDVLEVSPGYARNFLLPKGMVSMYNKTNLAILEGKQKAIAKRKEDKRKDALSVKEKITSAKVEFKMPAGDNGKLFGAVTSQMIVDELATLDIIVERKKVEIPGHTLKAVGNYKIHVRLYGGEEADLTVGIVPEAIKSSDSAPAPAAPVAAPAVEEAPAEAAAAEEAPAEEAAAETTEE